MANLSSPTMASLGLTLFHVYRQGEPIQLRKGDWIANLIHAGDVWARNSTHAMAEARAQGLAVAPLVEVA